MLIAENIFKESSSPKQTILRGCSLSLGQGEIVAIVGPSGAGKSSLLYCLGGLDPPTAGRVIIDGSDIYSMRPDDRARFIRERISFVFQEYNLLDFLNVEDNILFTDAFRRGMVDVNRLNAITNDLGISGLSTARISRLSGGEKQRVALARTFYSRPQMVFADEPTGALDSLNGAMVVEFFRGIASLGATVLIVTHDTGVASIANRVLVMKDGCVVDCLEKPTQIRIQQKIMELQNRDHHEQTYTQIY